MAARLNAAFRLVMIANRTDPQVLHDPERFDRLMGVKGRFAELESDTLELARRIVEGPAYRLGGNRTHSKEPIHEVHQDALNGQELCA